MSKKFRPGSMGAADEKAYKRFFIGACILIFIIALCCYVFPTDLRAWFRVTKSWTKYLGWLSFAAACFTVYKTSSLTFGEKAGGQYFLITLGLIILGICLACGFDFSYFRLR